MSGETSSMAGGASPDPAADPGGLREALERAEAARAQADERARLLFQASPIPKWIFALETLRFLDVNDAAIRRYGWSREEFLELTLREIALPPEAKEVESPHSAVPGEADTAPAEAPSNGETGPGRPAAGYGGTQRHRRRDGSCLVVEMSVVEIEFGGHRAGLAAIVDMTERSRIEQALRESEERFRTLADNIPQLAWMADSNGWIFWYNRRWYDYTGTTLPEMEGWGWKKVHHPDHVDRVVTRVQRSWTTGEPWEDTFPLRSRTGEYRWFLSRALPIRDRDGHVQRWFGTNTDVTEQIEVEDALRRAKEEAEHANRAKSDFLAAMSHELRTPLNAIGGYVDLIDLGIHGPVTEAQRADLSRIRLSGNHLLSLINDVLHFAKLEAGTMAFEIHPTRISAVLGEVASLVEPQMQRKALRHEFVPPDPAIHCLADRDRLAQILLNLAANAIKFTETGGLVRIWCETDGDRVLLRVSDTGRGIPPDRLESIFDPFVQLDRQATESSQQGVGLGLAISRDLARGMGGELSVESRVGEGSTFTLRLPQCEWESGS